MTKKTTKINECFVSGLGGNCPGFGLKTPGVALRIDPSGWVRPADPACTALRGGRSRSHPLRVPEGVRGGEVQELFPCLSFLIVVAGTLISMRGEIHCQRGRAGKGSRRPLSFVRLLASLTNSKPTLCRFPFLWTRNS